MNKMNGVQKGYEALKEYTENLEKENGRLNAAIQLLSAEKAQWIQSKDLQKQIISQQLTTSNNEVQGYLEEIQTLKEENRKLRDEA